MIDSLTTSFCIGIILLGSGLGYGIWVILNWGHKQDYDE